MSKKQRNRKTVNKNLRNRLINRRYKSTIKTLIKNIKKSLKVLSKEENKEVISEKQLLIEKTKNLVFSYLDKAVKKQIFHKNKAARKKGRLVKFIQKNLGL
jgi:small subunit ribosomal protein S20